MADLWALKDTLAAAGIAVSDMIDHGFICSIYAHDPNGIPIEFSANVADADVRKNPVMGDARPTSAAHEGAEPQPGHWPAVQSPTPPAQRVVRPGAGSELFHGVKT